MIIIGATGLLLAGGVALTIPAGAAESTAPSAARACPTGSGYAYGVDPTFWVIQVDVAVCDGAVDEVFSSASPAWNNPATDVPQVVKDLLNLWLDPQVVIVDGDPDRILLPDQVPGMTQVEAMSILYNYKKSLEHALALAGKD
jgi:hypothetical protein